MSRKKITIDISFPERLRILIKKKLKLTQIEFCENVGITQGYLSMVLGGKRGPSADLIAGLFIHYSEYLEWLLTGEDYSNKSKLDNRNQESITGSEADHSKKIFEQFKDSEQGKKNIGYLIQIEKFSDELYKKISGDLKTTFETAQILKNENRKKTS